MGKGPDVAARAKEHDSSGSQANRSLIAHQDANQMFSLCTSVDEIHNTIM